jgi:hypothetical protein
VKTGTWISRALVVVVAVTVLVQAFALGDTAFSATPKASTTALDAKKLCVVKKKNSKGKLVTVYVKKKVNGVVKKVPKKTAAACKKKTTTKKKQCVVKKKNSKGKLVTVYQTKVVKKKVRKNGKLVTVKKRVYVYKYVTKTVKGKKKRVKVKVPKMGPCKTNHTTSSGVPVSIAIGDPSVAHLDFGGFQRDAALSGTAKGFIVGKGFQLGQDNQIQLTSLHLNLAPTGIFIDDVCNGEVTDSIRTDPNTFVELDEGSTGNQVNVAANSSITGLLHVRVQAALDLRNDDDGCDKPYFTTGWTDFTLPLFVKGTLSANSKGIVSTLSTGETVLSDLSACLAPGDPNLPCDGFAIPFPAILTSKIVGVIKLGSAAK